MSSKIYNVTEVTFQFDSDPEVNLDKEQMQDIEDDTLGIWEADDEGDLVEQIRESTGWPVKSICYQIES